MRWSKPGMTKSDRPYMYFFLKRQNTFTAQWRGYFVITAVYIFWWHVVACMKPWKNGVNYKFTMHNIIETNWNGKNILSGHAVSCKSTKCMPKWNMASIQYKINPDEFNKTKYLVCHNLAKSIAFIGHLSLYVKLCLPHLRVQLLSEMTAIAVVICQWHKPPTTWHIDVIVYDREYIVTRLKVLSWFVLDYIFSS